MKPISVALFPYRGNFVVNSWLNNGDITKKTIKPDLGCKYVIISNSKNWSMVSPKQTGLEVRPQLLFLCVYSYFVLSELHIIATIAAQSANQNEHTELL